MSENIAEPPKSLNWNDNKQRALLGHLILDDKFFVQTKGRIDPKWFVDPYCERALKAMCEFHEKYKRPPTLAELKDYKEFRLEEKAWYIKFQALLDKCIELSKNYGLEYLRSELTDWMRARLFHIAVAKAVPLFNAEKPQAAYAELTSCTKAINEAKFDVDAEMSFDNPERLFTQHAEEMENALTFGIDCFDRLLTPDARHGSLLLGDTTVLLAPTNVGKTTCMITVAVHNILAGKPVLLITHEMRGEDVMKKLWCCILNVTSGELMLMYNTPEGRAKMDFFLQYIKRFLTYCPLAKPGLTVEEVIAIINRKQEERIARKGVGYAMVIDDYPAKLMSEEARRGQWARRQIDDFVYNQFVALALQHKFHALLAIQTNREGSKVNRGKEDRLLTMEDVSESWGPMTAATNVITLNRDPAAAARNRLTYYICKSRSSETGWAVVCRTNYAHARTHSNDMGATWYQSASTMAGKIDTLLTQHTGGAIPREEYVS